MPLFAYVCKKCNAQMELLLRADERPSCPQCGSSKMERQMSHFAAPISHSPEPACSGCAMAQGGCCPSQSACMS